MTIVDLNHEILEWIISENLPNKMKIGFLDWIMIGMKEVRKIWKFI